MKTLHLIIATCLLASAANCFAQKNFSLKGRVLDQQAVPVKGASVVNIADRTESVTTDSLGMFQLFTEQPLARVEVSKPGYAATLLDVGHRTFVEVVLGIAVDHKLVMEPVREETIAKDAIAAPEVYTKAEYHMRSVVSGCVGAEQQPAWNTESYSPIQENGFRAVTDEPLSTFSIDVDRASYTNVRRFINGGQLPPVDAVRIEEMINYFDYEYDAPVGDDPVNIFTEVSQAPWNPEHRLLHIGIKAREMDKEELPPSNLVFLIDVSGSMNSANKLPLLKSAMKMLVQELREEDHVAIVVYAGAAGLVLESTPGNKKAEINSAIERLSAGGSTAGGAGIKLAYEVARQGFRKNGNNRVILATDGDFNVGASSDAEMQRLIEEKRQEGVFLTVLGFGMGNYKDSKMEILADKGNGNYAYIDNITEARKTLVSEFGGTLFAVAKDVKIQVEFNPANVAEYRLIGYENRRLNNEDFNDDTKDAGEMGVGHVVTVLYEIVPAGKSAGKVDPLKYQAQREPASGSVFTGELATFKLRYKEPDGAASKLMSKVINKDSKAIQQASNNLQWSAAVAGFGMLLRNSEHKGAATYASLIELAEGATGTDKEGYRRECIQLMRSAELLAKNTTASR